MKKTLFLFFLSIGIAGLTHGFPLVDLFADEMYFVYGPLSAMQNHSVMPAGVPYGTVTFYAVYLLQGIFLSILFVFSGFDIGSAAGLIIQNPFLAYIATRALSLILFMAMIWIFMNRMKIGVKDEAPYAVSITLILFGNLTLLTFSHSGKMWITCIFLVFLAGHYISTKPKISALSSSLAFGNFPLMGIFWIMTSAYCLYLSVRKRCSLLSLLAIIIGVPLLIFMLNAESIILQINSIIFSYIAPNANGALVTIVSYLKTFIAYLIKLLLTSPFTLLIGILAFATHAKIIEKKLFWFCVAGLILYLLAMSAMFWSKDILSYLRYLLPFHALFLLLFSSIRFPKTALNTICMRALGITSIYLAAISTLNLAMPTTYENARESIFEKYNDKNTVIISNVIELSFPYNANSAKLVSKYTPGKCGNQCHYVLNNPNEGKFRGAYILSEENGKEIGKQILNDNHDAKIVFARVNPPQTSIRAEYGLGSYFVKEAWVPTTLGEKIFLESF